LINDASPDVDMTPLLREFAERYEHVSLYTNQANLGFVATVNLGMSIHPDRDVVLLNSDTEVVNDWLDRLARCAQGERVATVTPFSNNATICSFPKFCHSNPLLNAYSLVDIDRAFATANRGQVIEIPTGVGFCFYITRKSLNEIGYFDFESFGRGYGEENDFCIRARKAGWRNLLCCDTFVFHEGGVSFSDEQNERVENAQKILHAKYPDYHAEIQRHIQADPAHLYRVNAQLKLIGENQRLKILYLTHHMGGGTQKHINELAGLLKSKVCSLMLKPVGNAGVELSVLDDAQWERLYFKLPERYADLVQVLQALNVARVHFHHTVGLETSVWGLPESLGVPFDITIHDYHFIGGNPSLTDDQGMYSNNPEVQNSRYSRPVSLGVWQESQRVLLDAADRILTPSKAAADIFHQHYPELDITPVFHPDWYRDAPYPDVTRVTLLDNAPFRVLVIGAISLEKGANLLENVAKMAKSVDLSIEFHLLGYACRPLGDAVITHGAFDEDHVDSLINNLNPHLIWFPALWPETYSYTLSEALRSGRPILAPDIGAFRERLEGRPYTWIRPWDLDTGQWLDFLVSIRQQLINNTNKISLPWQNQHLPSADGDFYLNRYLEQASEHAEGVKPSAIELDALRVILEHSTHLLLGDIRIGRREKTLRRLIKLRNSRAGRLLASLIPLGLQRKVKRRLSSKPLHEIK
jgi:GT2 family glycosyltransferase